MPWTDEELVARSISGDNESFNELILRWERPIYALAYRTIGREEDARDVCQETFLRAFRALPGFRGQAKFSSWLYRIALNLCRDWVRRERRTPVVQPPEDVDLMDLAAATAGVAMAVTVCSSMCVPVSATMRVSMLMKCASHSEMHTQRNVREFRDVV